MYKITVKIQQVNVKHSLRLKYHTSTAHTNKSKSCTDLVALQRNYRRPVVYSALVSRMNVAGFSHQFRHVINVTYQTT